MEAILPISVRAKAAKPRVAAASQPLGATAPSSTLPLLFIVSGLLALLVGAGWLVGHPDILATYHYSPDAICVTHLFVLGWICSVVMGAVYQLVPVALETRLFSERLAHVQFVFHLTGFTGMVWSFHHWNLPYVAVFGSVLTTGVALFVFNITRTLARVQKWNVIASAVATAIGWVLLGVSAGLLIALGKAFYEERPAWIGWVLRFDPIGAMHAHAHLGALGLFIGLIVGVSYKLIPMFTLSELQNPRRAALSIWLLNAGLAGAFLTILLRSPWKPACAAVVAAAFLLYGIELRAILRARKRRSLDWGVRYFLTAVSLLAPVSIIALVLSWPGLPMNTHTTQLENVYGFLGLIGVVSLAIIGMLYKIVPFLVWFGAYSAHVGRAQVPALAEMYSARLQIAGYWAYLAGLLVTSVAMECSSALAVRLGCAILAAAFAATGMNIFKILRHFIRPQLKPLPQ